MLLVDTNIWLAAADRRSDRHGVCSAILRDHRDELAAPVTVIAETAWLVLDRLGTAAQAAFIRTITGRRVAPVDLTQADWQRCLELVERYASMRLDLVDASLVAVAGRLKLTRLATLNRRDFTVIRPRDRCRANQARRPMQLDKALSLEPERTDLRALGPLLPPGAGRARRIRLLMRPTRTGR